MASRPHAAIPHLGARVECNLLLILFAGNARVTDPLVISVIDPSGLSKALPPTPIAWNGPAEVTRLVIPLAFTAAQVGISWIRAQIRHRMLSGVPLTVELLPAIPEPFRQLAD